MFEGEFRQPLVRLMGGEQLAETCGMRSGQCDVITGMACATFVSADGELNEEFSYAGRLVC